MAMLLTEMQGGKHEERKRLDVTTAQEEARKGRSRILRISASASVLLGSVDECDWSTICRHRGCYDWYSSF